MGWFRFDDKAIDHPKFLALSDGAFRLWVEGGSYCNRHLTDGLILRAALNGFRYVTRKRVDELVKVALWEQDGDGFRIHDYHDWNDSKQVVEAKKDAGRKRTAKWRDAVTRSVSDASQHAHIASGVGSSSDLAIIQNVERESEGKPAKTVAVASGRNFGRIFLHRWQLDSLIATLGDHSDTFALDEWLDALNGRLAGVALPADPWKYVQSELHAEIQRRGLTVAAPAAAPPTNKRIAGLMAGGEAFLRRVADQKARERA